ncbi:hypothetical protein AWH49_16750 [Domibacillus aminovorans]|uniref:Helix-turn-helix domain-containing protein n=2 Tax=Domibacillus aminovorans TaxID=29332 RepID=A0A177L4L8_9BACI|nr:hypothetical protein AWH49_16750 [Domibacillus aminovorans]
MEAVRIEVDPKAIKKLAAEEIRAAIKEIDQQLVFWDTEELCRRTCMSLSSVQRFLLHQPGIPKKRVGQKWYFPAKETEEFLLDWLESQGD